MSFFNPGKNAVLSIVAVCLIVGIPASLIYLNDNYCTVSSDDADGLSIVGVPNSSASYDTIEPVSLMSDSLTLPVSTKYFYIPFCFSYSGQSSFSFDLTYSLISGSSTVGVQSVYLAYVGATSTSVVVPDIDGTVYSFNLDPVVIQKLNTDGKFLFVIHTAQVYDDVNFSYDLSLGVDSVSPNFDQSDILIIAGLVLIVLAIYASPFVQIDTPVKVAKRVGRAVSGGAGSAARWTKSTVKGRGKR